MKKLNRLTIAVLAMALTLVAADAHAFLSRCSDEDIGFQNYDFAAHRQKFANKFQESIAYKSQLSEEKRVRNVRDIRKELKRLEKSGKNTQIFGVLAAELFLYRYDVKEDERARLRVIVERQLLVGIDTPAAADAFAAYVWARESEVSEDDQSELPRRKALVIAALRGHQKHFPRDPRQMHLWNAALTVEDQEAARLALAKEYFLASAEMDNDLALFNSARYLVEFSKEGDPDRMLAARRLAPMAMALARQESVEKDGDYDHCITRFGGFDALRDAVTLAGQEHEASEFIRRMALIYAQTTPIATHAGFVFQDLALVFGARGSDEKAHIDAMAALGKRAAELERYSVNATEERSALNQIHMSPECSAPERAPACGLVFAGRLAVYGGAAGPMTIGLLQDAKAWAEKNSQPEELTARLSLLLAEAYWRFREPNLARTELESLRGYERLEPADKILFHRLVAELSDKILDAKTAVKSFGTVIEMVIEYISVYGKVVHQELDAIRNHADALVTAYVRGNFCGICGDEAAERVKLWLMDGAKRKEIKEMEAARKYLLYRLLPERLVERGDLIDLEDAIETSFGSQWSERARAIKQKLPKNADNANVLRASALMSVSKRTDVIIDAEQQSENLREITDFLFERGWDEKAALFEEWHAGWFSEATLEEKIDHLDDFARHLAAAGYSASARVVLASLAGEMDIAPDPSADGVNVEKDRAYLETVIARPFTYASICARLASLEIGAAELDQGSKHLDIAKRIATTALDRSFARGVDHVAPLLSELKPVLRLLAQLRIVVETLPHSDARSSKRADAAFEELQWAMLGDTGLGLLAGKQRRLMTDPAFGEAVTRLNTAKLELAQLETFASFVTPLDAVGHEARLSQLKKTVEELSTLVEREVPLAQSVSSLQPISLGAATKLLSPNDALLQLHAGSNAIYATLLRADNPLFIWKTDIGLPELEERIKTIRTGIDLSHGIPTFPLGEAHKLFQQLLGPIQERLSSADRLLVAVDGPLTSLPLAILPVRLPDSLPSSPSEYRTHPIEWLGLSHSIAYLPSLRILDLARQQIQSKAEFPFAGIGNPVLGGQANEVRSIDFKSLFAGAGGLADVDLIRAQAPLPETEIELKRLSSLLSGRSDDLFLGDRATESQLRSNGLSRYRMLAFATHGAMGGELGENSEPGLLLSPPEIASADDDGFLTAAEILSFNLDADLVLLSACNTAASDGRPRAEGFSGLTRSFLTAGARNIVATHWFIPSNSAVEVTTLMVEARQSDRTMTWSQALRLAYRKLVTEVGAPKFAHPAFWGAFAVIGADESP